MKRGLATGVGRIVGREKQVKLQVVDIYRLSAKQWRRLSPPLHHGDPCDTSGMWAWTETGSPNPDPHADIRQVGVFEGLLAGVRK